ncbi:MAG: gliding motility protein GldN [Candidatus Azobacteroides sp.]|nr:gliding motility protein GldN [Candidatus Azobacteroides sp.]
MKHRLLTILILSIAFSSSFAQEREFSNRRSATQDNSPTVSIRAQNMYGNTEINTDNVIWLREIYREIDLKQPANGPLYFPVEPVGDRVNLFTLIFNLLAEGKIPAYEYLDGREIFTDQYKVDFKDILNKFGIYYEETLSRSARNPVYSVHESDIPSNEALYYYIKEIWYFDQSSSTFDSQIVAFCPLLARTGDFGGEALKYPMFWVTYEDLRPYLSQVQIMTSNYNNVRNSTFNDYFRQHLYKGDIYKSTNLENLAIIQYADTDSLVKAEQTRIENELIAFEKNLWENPSEVIETLRNKKKLTKAESELLRKLEADEKLTAQEETAVASAVEEDGTEEEIQVKQATPAKSVKNTKSSSSAKSSSTKAPKQQKSPTRSVRRR